MLADAAGAVHRSGANVPHAPPAPRAPEEDFLLEVNRILLEVLGVKVDPDQPLMEVPPGYASSLQPCKHACQFPGHNTGALGGWHESQPPSFSLSLPPSLSLSLSVSVCLSLFYSLSLSLSFSLSLSLSPSLSFLEWLFTTGPSNICVTSLTNVGKNRVGAHTLCTVHAGWTPSELWSFVTALSPWWGRIS